MAMAHFTVDTANKLFVAKAGVTTFDVKVDLYSDAKEHWLLGGLPMGFDFPIRPVGGDAIDPASGTSIPLFGFFQDGWRIRPDEADHVLAVTGAIILVDGGGDPFVDTLGAFTVRINYQQPVQVLAQASIASLTSGESADLATIRKLLVNRIETDSGVSPAVFRVYDDDDIAIILEGPITEDVAGLIEYREQGYNRRGQLLVP